MESILISVALVRSQSTQPYEVIVSDDSNLNASSEVQKIVNKWECRYLSGPRRGLYANRNNAAFACKGTHIRTMDDDHEFPEKHFDTVEASVKSDPTGIWILGERGGRPSETSIGLPGELQPRGFTRPARDYDDCFAISDGATIYPREVFDNHHYLEVFKFGHLYSEFGARLKSMGYRIRLCPNTYVIHHYDLNNRSINDKSIELKSSFLASYLTYSCHFPSTVKRIECFAWFLGLAFLSSSKLKNESFFLSDFLHTWRLGRMYSSLFSSDRCAEVI
jgi:glycosyltransferase involved in cell wall biosynthesis